MPARNRNKLIELEFSRKISPSWSRQHKIRLFLPKTYENIIEGEVLASFLTDNGKLPAIVKSDKGILFNFDLRECINKSLYHRMSRPRPLFTYLPVHPHNVPARCRQFVKGLYKNFSGKKPLPTWNYVDILRWFMKDETASKQLWPGRRKYAVILSHDVDSGWIFRNSNFKKFSGIEEKYGFRSSWHIVTGKYTLDMGILEHLESAGHEIAFHGYKHDSKLAFIKKKEIEKRFLKSLWFLKRFKVRGVRTPRLSKTKKFYNVSERFFSYDSSFTTVSCYTVFPFFIGNLCELPITLPVDTEFLGNKDKDSILSALTERWEYIRKVGGLVSFSTHPEPHLAGNKFWLEIYDRFLKKVSEDPLAWKTTPKDVDGWYRKKYCPIRA
ncbi:hypothetical protein KY366_07925 [Candidatus Woesearchaeota archaeon]|nr:hypothetical protein [Candidatus Woesearchaeota archaeon]